MTVCVMGLSRSRRHGSRSRPHVAVESNEAHLAWPRRALKAMLSEPGEVASAGAFSGRTIRVWGLTRIPGSDARVRYVTVGRVPA